MLQFVAPTAHTGGSGVCVTVSTGGPTPGSWEVSPTLIAGKRVLVVEDGPTVTHGDAPSGAGLIAAHTYGAAAIVDPKPAAVGSIRRVFEAYDHLDAVLPAMGYSDAQIRDLEATIRNADPDVVVAATSHDLARMIDVSVPIVRVRYKLEETDGTLDAVLDRHAAALNI